MPAVAQRERGIGAEAGVILKERIAYRALTVGTAQMQVKGFLRVFAGAVAADGKPGGECGLARSVCGVAFHIARPFPHIQTAGAACYIVKVAFCHAQAYYGQQMLVLPGAEGGHGFGAVRIAAFYGNGAHHRCAFYLYCSVKHGGGGIRRGAVQGIVYLAAVRGGYTEGQAVLIIAAVFGVDDPRNSLYKELLEIVAHLQPDFVICENVKGLRSMLGGKVEQKILSDFSEIGYAMNVTTLCAADYYTPQKRERVIFIGNRIGMRNYHPRPILNPSEYITVGQTIADLMNHPEDPDFNHVPTVHSETMRKRIMECPEGQSIYKGYSDAWKKSPWNEPSCTIKENHGGVNVHPRLPRVLTAREMARLQSFPDDFIFEGKKAKQLIQIGNAVPCLLGKAIGLSVRYSNHDFEKE